MVRSIEHMVEAVPDGRGERRITRRSIIVQRNTEFFGRAVDEASNPGGAIVGDNGDDDLV